MILVVTFGDSVGESVGDSVGESVADDHNHNYISETYYFGCF